MPRSYSPRLFARKRMKHVFREDNNDFIKKKKEKRREEKATISWKSVHERFRGPPLKGLGHGRHWVEEQWREPYPGILTRNTSKTRHTRVHLRLDYPLDQHAYTLFMPCKGCVFDTRGPRWKSKRASHSRGPVINVRVNSRLVRDRKVAGYSRYGSPQENHKVRVWCYQSESERERERPFSILFREFQSRIMAQVSSDRKI